MPFIAPIRPLPALALAAALGLAACAPLPQKPREGTPPPQEKEQAKESDREAGLPHQELTGGILYQMLMAEIALHRAQPETAFAAYADLAKSTKDPRILRRAVELAAVAHQPKLELELAQTWVDMDPQSVRARQLLVAALAAAGRLEDAEPHIAFLLEKDPGHVGLMLMRLARSAAMNPRRKELAAMLDRLAAIRPDVPESHFVRAYAALSEGKNDLAREEAAKARANRPDWEPPVLLEAQLIQDKSGKGEAMKFLRAYLEKHPKAKDVRLQYARALAADKNYTESRSQFQILERDVPGNGDVTHALAVLSVQLGDLEGAEKYFKVLLKAGEGDANALRLSLGQIAEARNKLDEARAWYEAVPPGGQYLEARIKAATIVLRQKGPDEAVAYLKILPLEQQADRVQVVLAQSQILRTAGRDKDAYQTLDKELRSFPDDPDLLYESALLAEGAGHFEVLEPRLKKLIKLKPDHAHAYNALGYSLADRGERLTEAEQLIRKALELAPDDAFITDSLGWVFYRQGKLPEARQTLEKAMALRADPEIAAHLGEVLWKTGKTEEATRIWREAAKASPDNAPLKATMKKFLGPE